MADWLLPFQLGLYDLVVKCYFLGIRIASSWNVKAAKWIEGRAGVFEQVYIPISQKRTLDTKLVWMHCASLGEFEQGRTLLEHLRKHYPHVQILLTFFSPSGYEIRKEYPIADWVAYLPADSAAHAMRFFELVRPDIAIFVKYEFWFHYLATLQRKQVPALLISSIFRPNQPFFKWYGSLHRRMLESFAHIFVQDEPSQLLLKKIGIGNSTIAGDTRVDRVAEIASNPMSLPLLEGFSRGAKVLVCGSTWSPDEALLFPIFANPKYKDWKFILAPHDVQSAHLQEIKSRISVPFSLYSEMGAVQQPSRVLVVDNIGMLSSIYQFGHAAYIGGGFGQGIHNTLEPAAYGLPIIFGPKYQKFEEARWMVANEAAFVIQDKESLDRVFGYLTSTENRVKAGQLAKNFIEGNKGGTNVTFKKLADFLGPNDK